MKKHHKYILDLIMTIIMVLLMKIIFVGILWHEILGLGILFLFIVHNILNFKCFKTVLLKFNSKSIKTKTKVGIVLDILLTLVVVGIIFTGILISKELFPFAMTGFVSSLHHSLSYLALILISVHIGLHWLEIMGGLRKLFRLETLNKGRTYFLRVVTIFIVIFGIKGSFSQDLSGNLLEVVNGVDDKTDSDIQPVGFSKEETSDDYDEHDEEETDNHENRSDDEEKITVSSDTTTTAPVSLEEYLSKLHCTGCNKHCPLTAPQCGIGEQQAIQAADEYKATQTTTYITTETTKTTPDAPSENPAKTSDLADTTTTTAPATLEEYLSKLVCNGCSRHCPLSAPQCGVGEQQAVEATSQYYIDIGSSGEIVSSFTLGEVLTDYLPIMGMFIAGTHYLVMIPKYLKERDL
ncbi:MAG: DUF4405 domain-containing protein [Firmicutes bacterium]|nr:DUF4405 domain-containing protein [Bacillota bacterium]